MTISSRGLDFVVRHEGFVSKAYRDPVGVWTIGTGFTNRSRVATKILGSIGPGRTITRAENDQVLAAAFAEEYGPPVDKAMSGARQHELDAGYSYCFNCGPGAMSDKWVGLWREGKKNEAAERLKVTRVTAKGQWLRGLANRRADEAKLLLTGDYGDGQASVEEPPKYPGGNDYHSKLQDLGYDSVLSFQKHHPHLVDDGILGSATRAQIDRDISAKNEGKAVGLGVVVLTALGAAFPWIAVVVGVALVGWFVLRRREEITHWVKNKIKD